MELFLTTNLGRMHGVVFWNHLPSGERTEKLRLKIDRYIYKVTWHCPVHLVTECKSEELLFVLLKEIKSPLFTHTAAITKQNLTGSQRRRIMLLQEIDNNSITIYYFPTRKKAWLSLLDFAELFSCLTWLKKYKVDIKVSIDK